MSHKKILWTNLIGACLWCIGVERNKRTLKDDEKPPDHGKTYILNLVFFLALDQISFIIII